MNITPLRVDGKWSGFLFCPPCFSCTNSATVDAKTIQQQRKDDPFVDVLQETCFVFKYFTHSASKQNYTSIVFPHVRIGTRTIYLLTLGKPAIPLSTLHPSIHHPPGPLSRETEGHGREAMWILRKAGGPNSPCFQRRKKGGKSFCKSSIAIEIHDI